jgi:hypothetical protein
MNFMQNLTNYAGEYFNQITMRTNGRHNFYWRVGGLSYDGGFVFIAKP